MWVVVGIAVGLSLLLGVIAGVVHLVRDSTAAPAGSARLAVEQTAARSGLSRAVAVLGIAAAALVACSPVHVHELGTDINCGLGPVAVQQQPYADGSNLPEVQMCQHEGGQRIVYGGGIAVVALVAAGVLRRGR